jgi:hypothetical protein
MYTGLFVSLMYIGLFEVSFDMYRSHLTETYTNIKRDLHMCQKRPT